MEEQITVTGELGQKIDSYLTAITPFGFASTISVAKDGEIVLNKGYGLADRAAGLRNTAVTVHSLGSITKQFTAAAIMKLEMMGKLQTDDLIGRYLPNVPPDKAGITLHHLLTHTAGVLNYTGDDYDMADREETLGQLLYLKRRSPATTRRWRQAWRIESAAWSRSPL